MSVNALFVIAKTSCQGVGAGWLGTLSLSVRLGFSARPMRDTETCSGHRPVHLAMLVVIPIGFLQAARMPTGILQGPYKIPTGFRPESCRIPTGFLQDSYRVPIRFLQDSYRIHVGFISSPSSSSSSSSSPSHSLGQNRYRRVGHCYSYKLKRLH